MDAKMNTSLEGDGVEGRLWEYIDGSGSMEERSVIIVSYWSCTSWCKPLRSKSRPCDLRRM
jgi:hypothetical protein